MTLDAHTLRVVAGWMERHSPAEVVRLLEAARPQGAGPSYDREKERQAEEVMDQQTGRSPSRGRAPGGDRYAWRRAVA